MTVDRLGRGPEELVFRLDRDDPTTLTRRLAGGVAWVSPVTLNFDGTPTMTATATVSGDTATWALDKLRRLSHGSRGCP